MKKNMIVKIISWQCSRFTEQKQTETKNEDEVCEPSINVVKDLDEKTEIQAEESIAEPTVVELSNSSNTQQNDNKEGTSEIVIQYQKIIEAALDKQAEIKLSEIVVMIKEMTGKKVQNSNVESVAKEMKGIEIFKIGQAKAIRRTTGLLFN